MQLLSEFANIVKKTDNMCDLFGSNWEIWAPKVVSYAKASCKAGTAEYLDILSGSTVAKGTYNVCCDM